VNGANNFYYTIVTNHISGRLTTQLENTQHNTTHQPQTITRACVLLEFGAMQLDMINKYDIKAHYINSTYY